MVAWRARATGPGGKWGSMALAQRGNFVFGSSSRRKTLMQNAKLDIPTLKNFCITKLPV
jgi:hypothetical protein